MPWYRFRLLRQTPWVVLSSIVVLAVALTGCSQPTAEEKLEMAREKVEIQRPPDYLGATILLKDVIKLTDIEPGIKLNAYMQLASIYMRIGELEKSEEFLIESRDYFGTDTEEGQTTVEMLIQVQESAAKPDEALANAQALLSRDDLPVPRRTRMRIREAALLAATEQQADALEKFHAMALEFDEPQLEQLTLERFVQLSAADGQIAGAQAYETFIAEKPDSALAPMARFGAGFFYMQAGEPDKGIPLMEEYIAGEEAALAELTDPRERVNRALQLGRAYKLAGKDDEERAMLRKFADEFKTDTQVGANILVMLAGSYFQSMDFENGLAVLEEIQTTYAGTQFASEASKLQSRMLAAMVQYEKSKAELEAAGELIPSDDGLTSETLGSVESAIAAEPAAEAAVEAEPAAEENAE